jgi:octaprenyl-diphosphate synthase
VLDYSGDVSITGKKIGDDILDGKMTLPVIYLLKNGNTKQKNIVESVFNSTNTVQGVEKLIYTVVNSGAIEYSKMKALEYAKQAELHILQVPPSKYRDSLQKVIEFSINRIF